MIYLLLTGVMFSVPSAVCHDTAPSGFGAYFGAHRVAGDMGHSCTSCGSDGDDEKKTTPRQGESGAALSLRVPSFLLSSVNHMWYTLRPSGRANSHTVFCTPHRHGERGR